MTRVVNFHHGFKYSVIGSLAVIVAGLIGVSVIGFNNGVDFQAGLNVNLRFAPPSMGVSYTGDGIMTLSVTKSGVDLISQAPTGESKAFVFSFLEYPTLKALADGMQAVPGVGIELKASANLESKFLLGASQTDALLTAAPAVLHHSAAKTGELELSVEAIRAAMRDFGDVSIQRVGDQTNREFMVRVEDPGVDKAFVKTVGTRLTATLGSSFGAENILINRVDYVGPRFSANLARQAAWLTLLTFAVVFLYCSVRFKPVYAIGAVLAVVHDALVMVAFIVFTRMEFNTAIIAAILTIIGFSINDTIVIYDRIREKVKLNPGASFRENMNRGITETLGRTFITSGTVLLSTLSLYIFTTGSMKDFSLSIIVGLVSGTYSTIFIASAFIDLWTRVEAKLERKKLDAAATAQTAAKALAGGSKTTGAGAKAGKSAG